MEKSDVERLLEEMKKHPEADKLMKEYGKMDTFSEYAETILFVARKLGIEIQTDQAEIVSYLKEKESSIKAATDQASSEIVELDDDEVEDVVGGGVGPTKSCGSKMREKYEELDECILPETCDRILW